MSKHVIKKNLRKPTVEDVRLLRTIIDYQLGTGIGYILVPSQERVLVYKSPNTLKIREVYVDSNLCFTLRANDMKVLLHMYAAKLLTDNTNDYPYVKIASTISDYIVNGGNVFSKHVIEVKEGLHANDEVIIIDEDNKLIGVGYLKLSPSEILFFTRGEAVRVRETIKKLVRLTGHE